MRTPLLSLLAGALLALGVAAPALGQSARHVSVHAAAGPAWSRSYDGFHEGVDEIVPTVGLFRDRGGRTAVGLAYGQQRYGLREVPDPTRTCRVNCTLGTAIETRAWDVRWLELALRRRLGAGTPGRLLRPTLQAGLGLYMFNDMRGTVEDPALRTDDDPLFGLGLSVTPGVEWAPGAGRLAFTAGLRLSGTYVDDDFDRGADVTSSLQVGLAVGL